jgi:predicted Zn-dependent protease
MTRPVALAIWIVASALAAGSATAMADADTDADELAQARSHLVQGKALLDAKAYDQAIVELEAAKRHASFPELQAALAEAYRLGGRTTKAIAAYQELLATTPTGAVADDARHWLEARSRTSGTSATSS